MFFIMLSTQKLLSKGMLSELIDEGFHELTRDLSLLKKFNENILISLIMKSAKRGFFFNGIFLISFCFYLFI